MKNSEIHAGLDQKEVRDFLSHQLAECYTRLEIKEIKSFSGDPLDWAIESARNAKDLATAQLERAEQRKAIITLVKKMGWQEFDVSEMVIKDMAWWWNFLGTEEEYQVFAGIIKNED